MFTCWHFFGRCGVADHAHVVDDGGLSIFGYHPPQSYAHVEGCVGNLPKVMQNGWSFFIEAKLIGWGGHACWGSTFDRCGGGQGVTGSIGYNTPETKRHAPSSYNNYAAIGVISGDNPSLRIHANTQYPYGQQWKYS